MPTSSAQQSADVKELDVDEPPENEGGDAHEQPAKPYHNKRWDKIASGVRWFIELLDTYNGVVIAFGTLVIAAFTVVLAIATLELKHLGEKQAEDTSTLARAALQQAEAANNQVSVMERQLRPYLSIKNFEFPCVGCKDWQGRVTAINRGQTPARQVEFLVSWDTDPGCGHLNKGFRYHYKDDGSNIRNPRDQKTYFDHLRAFSRDDEDTATFTLIGDLTEASKAAIVCIYGAFLYVVPKGDVRPDTHFCWWYRPGDRGRDLCEDQNDLN
jgi:hypothetical protein